MCIANLLHPQILHKIGWLKNYVTCSDVSVSGSIGLFWVVVSALPILFTKNISQIMIIFVISLAFFLKELGRQRLACLMKRET